jgi:protein involved in polysaccharide export with SLBB domain
VLARGTEVEWIIKSVPGQPNGAMNAHGTVMPDGTLELGPYGSVAVAGLTVPQAAKAVEKQVARYLKGSKVYLRVVPPDNPGPVARALTPAVPVPEALMQTAVRPVVQWSSDDQGSQPVAAPSLTVQGGPGTVGLVATQITTSPDGPFLEPIGEPRPKNSKPPDKKTEPNSTKDKKDTKETKEEAPPPRPLADGPPLLGPPEGMPDPHSLDVPPVPGECRKVTLPPYRVAPPDILLIESLAGLKNQVITGPHLVRPDGTVSLGIYGSIYVAGKTLDQIKEDVARAVLPRLRQYKPKSKKEEQEFEAFAGYKYEDVLNNVSVDVLAYNSKVYYVISDAAGLGDQVVRLPITGNETVLDAIGLNPIRGSGTNGLLPVASKKHIWVARPDCQGQHQILPVDWIGITQRGESATNYQIMPGDRVYVKADCWRRFNNNVDRVLSPIERILGVTLLGSQVVNSIRSGGTSTSVP